MKIGNTDIGRGLCLAPMAGVTDLPFRLLCREQGCGYAVTEMISVKALHYHNRGTAELLKTVPADRPLGVQLFGSDPELAAEEAARLEDGPWDIFDFNMGCPVPKVVNNGEGSALLKNPALASAIVSALAKRLKKPVTVKMRIGFGSEPFDAPAFARMLEEAGAAAITVHGRTREQFYSGKADRETIRKIREAVHIPVLANGDIFSAEDAKRMLAETGCDGIMIARGAEGNPWIFGEISAYLQHGGPAVKPDAGTRRRMILRHLAMQIEQDGEKEGILKMRKQIGWYLHGLPNAAAIRNAVNTTEDRASVEQLIDRAFS